VTSQRYTGVMTLKSSSQRDLLIQPRIAGHGMHVRIVSFVAFRLFAECALQSTHSLLVAGAALANVLLSPKLSASSHISRDGMKYSYRIISRPARWRNKNGF
jgi:hypothetical protein